MHFLFEIIECCLVKILLISNAFLWILCESRQLLGIGTRLASNGDGEYIHTFSSWKTAGVNTGNNNMDNDFRSGNQFIPFQIWVTIIISLFVFFLMLCYCCIAWEMRRRQLWSNVDANPSRNVGQRSNMNPYPSQPAGQWSSANSNPFRPQGLWSNANPNPPRPQGLWSNANANPPRPAGQWSNVTTNPSQPVGLWSNMNPNPSRPVMPTAPPVLQESFLTPVDGNDGRMPIGGSDVPPDYSAVTSQDSMMAISSDNSDRYPRVVAGRKAESPPPDYMTVAPFK